MFSIKRGVLRVDADREAFFKAMFCLFFLMHQVSLFALYQVQRGTTVFAVGMFIVSFFLLLGRRENRVILPYNTVWYAVLTLFAFASLYWSEVYSRNAVDRCWRMAVICLFVTAIVSFVDSDDDLESLMKMYVLASLVVMVLEFSSVPSRVWSKGQMGQHFSGFNPNSFGLMMFFSEMFCFFFFYNGKGKFYLPLSGLFLTAGLFSSSRKVFFASFIAPIIMVGLSVYKKRYVRNLLIILAFSFVAIVAVMNTGGMFARMSERVEHMFTFFTNNQSDAVDGSLYIRRSFIESAKLLFAESPVLGKGIENFEILSSRRFGGRSTYCHNNYWQLLSELGIIGFIIYYSMYAYILVKLCSNMFRKRSRISILFFTLILFQLVMEYALVSFTAKTSQVNLALIFCATYVGSMDGRKYSYKFKESGDLQ